MCGRYSLSTDTYKLAQHFRLDEPPALIGYPRYNIAPSQVAPVVRLAPGDGGGRVCSMLRWGLIPSWATDPAIGNRMINARAETLGHKPAFRAALRARRCLVPADGFYEWQVAGGRKQPMFIVPRGGGPMAFAGLWEQWQGKLGPGTRPGPGAPPGAEMLPFDVQGGSAGASNTTVESFTIITTDANADLRPIHDRMPAVLAPGDYARWLDPAVAGAEAEAMLRPYPDGLLRAYPVSPRVNSPKVDDASCCAEGEMGHDQA